MPPPAQGQQGKEPDNTYSILWIIGLTFIVGFAFWYSFHDYIILAVFHVKLVEATAISLFTSSLDNAITVMRTVPLTDITFKDMWAVSTLVGDYLRYPLILIIGILAAILYTSDITQRYRKIYSMKTLLDEEYVNWPHVTPVLKLDLVSQDVDKGPWAVSVAPRAFATKHKLIKRDLTERPTMRRERNYVYATIHRGEAKRIFVMQLGPYWTGPDALPPHTKALLAIFAAKINRDRDGVAKMMTQLSRTSGKGQPNYSGMDALLAKHFNNKDVVKIYQRHAYVLTVMASMLERSREDGVLPSAEFLWLKPIDRPLWYLLNSVGRQTSFTEVAGPFAHWLAEKALDRRCLVPMVGEAVTALESAIKDIKFKAEDLPA